MKNKLQKIYPTYYNLLIVQNLWQSRYQILSIIFLKEFIKLNVNMYRIIKKEKLGELNINFASATKTYQQTFDEKLKEQFFNTYTFSNH